MNHTHTHTTTTPPIYRFPHESAGSLKVEVPDPRALPKVTLYIPSSQGPCLSFHFVPKGRRRKEKKKSLRNRQPQRKQKQLRTTRMSLRLAFVYDFLLIYNTAPQLFVRFAFRFAFSCLCCLLSPSIIIQYSSSSPRFCVRHYAIPLPCLLLDLVARRVCPVCCSAL